MDNLPLKIEKKDMEKGEKERNIDCDWMIGIFWVKILAFELKNG